MVPVAPVHAQGKIRLIAQGSLICSYGGTIHSLFHVGVCLDVELLLSVCCSALLTTRRGILVNIVPLSRGGESCTRRPDRFVLAQTCLASRVVLRWWVDGDHGDHAEGR